MKPPNARCKILITVPENLHITKTLKLDEELPNECDLTSKEVICSEITSKSSKHKTTEVLVRCQKAMPVVEHVHVCAFCTRNQCKVSANIMTVLRVLGGN